MYVVSYYAYSICGLILLAVYVASFVALSYLLYVVAYFEDYTYCLSTYMYVVSYYVYNIYVA